MLAMLARYAISAIALTLATAIGDARATDAPIYPNLSGWFVRIDTGHGAGWDPNKSQGLSQEAPLTPEYQAILRASLASLAAGGQGNNTMAECIPPGMPRTMTDYEGMEFIVTPEITYVHLIEPVNHLRRIYTDGRDWPDHVAPTLNGYSIGRWRSVASNRHDVLDVETRYLRGPRTFESSGMRLHDDNQTVIRETIYGDDENPDIVHDRITTIDRALTQPWTVLKNYRRIPRPVLAEQTCAEANQHVFLRRESYYVSMDGYLMPTRRDQPAPDLRNFAPGRK
jgi:hypothetical protein